MDGLDVISEGACEVVNVGDDETTLGATEMEPSHTEARERQNSHHQSECEQLHHTPCLQQRVGDLHFNAKSEQRGFLQGLKA